MVSSHQSVMHVWSSWDIRSYDTALVVVFALGEAGTWARASYFNIGIEPAWSRTNVLRLVAWVPACVGVVTAIRTTVVTNKGSSIA